MPPRCCRYPLCQWLGCCSSSLSSILGHSPFLREQQQQLKSVAHSLNDPVSPAAAWHPRVQLKGANSQHGRMCRGSVPQTPAQLQPSAPFPSHAPPPPQAWGDPSAVSPFCSSRSPLYVLRPAALLRSLAVENCLVEQVRRGRGERCVCCCCCTRSGREQPVETEKRSLPSGGLMRCLFRFDLQGQTTEVAHVKRAKTRR